MKPDDARFIIDLMVILFLLSVLVWSIREAFL